MRLCIGLGILIIHCTSTRQRFRKLLMAKKALFFKYLKILVSDMSKNKETFFGVVGNSEILILHFHEN